MNTDYLIHPDLYRKLNGWKSFRKINGNTYQNIIIEKYFDKLTDKMKKEILDTNTPEDALMILKKYKINYCHKLNYPKNLSCKLFK
jgi:hypothetical protein